MPSSVVECCRMEPFQEYTVADMATLPFVVDFTTSVPNPGFSAGGQRVGIDAATDYRSIDT